MSLCVGLGSGLGNTVFMLPVVRALYGLGKRIDLFVNGDFPMAALWQRCKYAHSVITPPAKPIANVSICGHWRPPGMEGLVHHYRFTSEPHYPCPEWKLPMAYAERLGWANGRPDVSDWCRDLDRTPRWDVGIIPGSKGGIWLRKRWPGMAEIATHYLAHGLRVAVFGSDGDGCEEVSGEPVRCELAALPDKLAGCRVIIGTDSGPTQLASSLGVPVVMLYTSTSEVKGEPVGSKGCLLYADLPCRPCQATARWWNCEDWNCRRIPVDAVLEAAEEWL